MEELDFDTVSFREPEMDNKNVTWSERRRLRSAGGISPREDRVAIGELEFQNPIAIPERKYSGHENREYRIFRIERARPFSRTSLTASNV